MGQFFNIWGNWNKFFEQHLDLLQQFLASIRFNQKTPGGGNNFLRAWSKKNYVPLKFFSTSAENLVFASRFFVHLRHFDAFFFLLLGSIRTDRRK